MGKYSSKRNDRQAAIRYTLLIVACVVAALLMIVVPLSMMMDAFEQLATAPTTSGTTTAPTTTQTPTTQTPTTQAPTTLAPVVKESSFTLSATGDVLMHMPVVNASAVSGGYDFSPVFSYFMDYVQKADYAAANLETTLAGTDNGYAYSGYPCFNCPDQIVTGLKNAGFDLVLTANNHSYDTRGVGMRRTVQTVRDLGLANLGTKADANEPNYLVVERNGISLGLMCYTYEDNSDPAGKAPNWITMKEEDAPLINSFDYTNLDLFYNEIRENMAQMEDQGADATVLFIHWGYEYQTTEHKSQNEIAQALCDLGVDVIIGGHPHVVQPVELLTSTTDDTQKTVCLYSMGNAVSNQRRQNMNLNTGHTEDGVLFSVTFSRYSDGTVILESADLLPTWVFLGNNPVAEKWAYTILPLDDQIEDWQSAFNMPESVIASAKASYDRTMAIVGEGMAEVDAYLAQNVMDTEAALGVQP